MLSLPGTNGGRNGCILSRLQLLSVTGSTTDSLARGRHPSFAADRLHQAKRCSQLGLGHKQPGPCTTVAVCFSDLMTAFRIPGALQCTVKLASYCTSRARPETWLAVILQIVDWLIALPCMGSGSERSNTLACQFASLQAPSLEALK